ncbi:MAG: hypothetical protein PF795_08090, partial [Kiritimatiellae bacterium]|nr:hypothetical protein [Kiritimatiellia bacterium]
NMLDPRSGVSSNFERTYTHVFRFSKDLSRMVGFYYADSHFSPGGTPPDSFRMESNAAGPLRTYNRQGRTFIEDTTSQSIGRVRSISLSPDSRMVSMVHESHRGTIVSLSHRNARTLEPLNLSLDLSEKVQGFAHHPFFPLAIAWDQKEIRLLDLRPDGNETRTVALPERMVLVDRVDWAGNGDRIFVFGKSRNQRPLFCTLVPDFTSMEKAAFSRLPPLPEVALPKEPASRPDNDEADGISESPHPPGLVLSENAFEIVGRAVQNLPPPGERNLEDPEQTADARNAVLEVRAGGERKGFGILFSTDGLAILPLDILPPDDRPFTLHLRLPEGVLEFQGEVVAADPDRGVVFARPRGTLTWPCFPIDFTSAPVNGDAVWFLLPEAGVDTARIVSAERYTVDPGRAGLKAGRPLFTQQGNVVGLLLEESPEEGVYTYLPIARIGESLRAIAETARKQNTENRP